MQKSENTFPAILFPYGKIFFKILHLGCCSMIECLPSMPEALGLTPSNVKTEKFCVLMKMTVINTFLRDQKHHRMPQCTPSQHSNKNISKKNKFSKIFLKSNRGHMDSPFVQYVVY
jgi:hypothetical protein